MIQEFNGANRWLSNFAPCNVILDGVVYPSTENAYQAAKTVIKQERAQFEGITAGQAKRAGQRVTMRPDWDAIKLPTMENLNRQKYTLEPLRSKLLATGFSELREGNTWGDTFWGVCNGRGDNHLGKIIMKIRTDLQRRP